MLWDEAIARLAHATISQTDVENETKPMPLTPEQRSQINKANSLKSTGPSAAGKLRSRGNALKHGLRAKVLALPNEDPEVVEARSEAWNEYYQPQSPGAQHLVNQCVHATLLADRCQRFHGAERDKQIREAPFHRTNSRVDDLHRLDALLTKDPGRAVGELRRTAHGCRWLIDRWQPLADVLESGRAWERSELCDAIYLSGRLPQVWAVDPDVHRLTLYTMLMTPECPEAELQRFLNKTLLSPSVIAQVLCDLPPDPEECRRRLRDIVQSELKSLRDDERALHEQLEGPSDALLMDRSLILADGQAARLFLRYHAESRSAFHRSYSELIRTLKRDAEEGIQLEDVSEPSCPDEMSTECDQTCTSSAEEPVGSGVAGGCGCRGRSASPDEWSSCAENPERSHRHGGRSASSSLFAGSRHVAVPRSGARGPSCRENRPQAPRPVELRRNLAQGIVDMKPHSARGAIAMRAGNAGSKQPRCGFAGSVRRRVGLADLRRGERAEDRQHRVKMGKTGAEPIDEVGQRELAVHEVLVVLGHVVRQLTHQGRVDLFEEAERFLAVFEDLLMAVLPPLELRHLPSALLPADLRCLARQLELLPLNLQALALELKRLRAQVQEQVEQGNWVVHVRDGWSGSVSGGGNLHPVRPVGRRWVLT